MVNEAAKTDARQERGLALYRAKKPAIRHIVGGKYLVPSAGGGKDYVVDVEERRCTCPDHEDRAVRCKHMWAISYFREEVVTPDGTTVVTETAKVVRLTYKRDWRAYNPAQCEEGDVVPVLLAALCAGIAEPPQAMGRPRVPLRDGIFAAAMKVYGLKSGRRSSSAIRASERDGLIGRAPSHVTVARVIERADLTPLLTSLVNESATPLARAETETQYAVDSTGFATTTYDRWFDYRYGTPEPRRRQRFLKCHALVGTHTHVVAAVRVTDMHGADSPEFIPLLGQAAANGVEMQEVSADKAYLSHDNLAAVEALGASPFIPLKSNSTGTGSPQMERLTNYISLYEEEFLAHYHRRSNVETVFSMIKAKFDASLRSKLPAAQVNEVLLKCLCHNLSCLVLAIRELHIDPKFWAPKPAQVTP